MVAAGSSAAPSVPTRRAHHWDRIYRTKPEEDLSWHQDDPSLSVELILRHAPPPRAVIDIGGGSSVLADRLVARGYGPVAVVDISASALRRARGRLGPSARRVRWIVGDVTTRPSLGRFDVWHDRAVLHFLTSPRDRARYGALLRRTLVPGGILLIATFALDGPETCSGLPVERYDAAKLSSMLGPSFALVESTREVHRTPWGADQPFTYAVFRRGTSDTGPKPSGRRRRVIRPVSGAGRARASPGSSRRRAGSRRLRGERSRRRARAHRS